MSDLTGLQSILSRSHFRTQRKNKYSFGKSQRFPQLKSKYTIDFYNTPNPRNTRTCSFGYGSKYFFDKPTLTPSSSTYIVDQNDTQNGQTFGASRQKTTIGSYLYSDPNKGNAGLKYDPNIESSSKFKKSPQNTMGSKRSLDQFIQIPKEINPEPSKYDLDLQKNGKLTLSNFKTTRKAFFPKTQRFINSLEKSLVGPSQYNADDHFSSKHKLAKRGIIGQAKRRDCADDAIKKSVTPGPIYYIP